MALAVPVALAVGRVVLVVYETRSRRVKPSCAVTKLTLARGRRLLCAYRSEEPVRREANSPSVCGSVRQKSRTASRYLPFHSDHSWGKLPTWYPPSPTSHGSAMSLTRLITGSCWMRSKNAESRSTCCNCRARVAAKSTRQLRRHASR
ncbi:hypothetical protein SHIRM173S_01317 [Streptomyces hirsutus]